ncbi:MAG: hypothetical protein K8U57_04095 [Planctomycetes bacterium]|nr:hypothetical protein [Planctomycetota bacterium]
MILGNVPLVQFLKQSLTDLLGSAGERNLETAAYVVSGASHSGKSRCLELFCQRLACRNRDPNNLDPCGKCLSCTNKEGQGSNEGLWSMMNEWGGGTGNSFMNVDASELGGRADVTGILERARDLDGPHPIVVLDEAHRIGMKKLDEMFLIPIMQYKCIWFFVTTYPEHFEQMFQNRLIRLQTTPPTEKELAGWIADRCDELGMPWNPEAVIIIVQRTGRIPGLALKALNEAALSKDGLTLEFAESWSPN